MSRPVPMLFYTLWSLEGILNEKSCTRPINGSSNVKWSKIIRFELGCPILFDHSSIGSEKHLYYALESKLLSVPWYNRWTWVIHDMLRANVVLLLWSINGTSMFCCFKVLDKFETNDRSKKRQVYEYFTSHVNLMIQCRLYGYNLSPMLVLFSLL